MIGARGKPVATRVALSELGISLDQISASSKEIIRTLQQKGFEAYVVGGAVRDLLLGLHPRDFDVVTSARPEQVKKCFRRAWIIGRRFQLVHVKLGNELIEVSTLRADPVKGRFFRSAAKPSENKFGTIETDVLLRDMTINALYLDPIAQEVIDFVAGIADARKRTLKLIGRPKERYLRDPVRMIRILRLAAKLECELDPASVKPIRKNAALLQEIAHSRLLEEFIKVVSSGHSARAFELFEDHGIIPQLFPHLVKLDLPTKRFIELALIHNDRLIHRNKRNSLSYLVSSFYWPTISTRWNEACSAKRANMQLMHDLFAESGILENRILTHNLRSHVQRIWEFQSRFYRQKGKRKALAIQLNNHAAEKALAFLQLRLESREIDSELADWWQGFAALEGKERESMLTQPARRRRRRRKGRSSQDGSAATGDDATTAAGD